MTETLYDTVIIGGGPAAAGAAVYAGRKKMRTLLITQDFGGQSQTSARIENWIGETAISGPDLAAKLRRHIQAQPTVEILSPARVTEVRRDPDCLLVVSTEGGDVFRAKTVILASGGSRRRLDIHGEERLKGRGVAYCSTCDAPFFQDRDVAVVGGGNTALETVIDLAAYAKRIYLLIRREKSKGDPAIQEKMERLPQLQTILKARVQEILGDQGVTGLRYEDSQGRTKELAVQGVFVAVGSRPNSDYVQDLVDTNEAGEILVDHRTGETSQPGIFAAGDVTNDPFKQNNISAGDGVRAALSAYYYLLDIKRFSPCAESEP
jgi:alkyl hydroperoxide reductase subunit F